MAHRLRQSAGARVLAHNRRRGHRPGDLAAVPATHRHAERTGPAPGSRRTTRRHVRGAVADDGHLGLGQRRSVRGRRHGLLARHQRTDRSRPRTPQLRREIGARSRGAHPRVERRGGRTASFARAVQRHLRERSDRSRFHGRPAGWPHRMRGSQSRLGAPFGLCPHIRGRQVAGGSPPARPGGIRRHAVPPRDRIRGSPSSTGTPHGFRSARYRVGPSWCRCPGTADASIMCFWPPSI